MRLLAWSCLCLIIFYPNSRHLVLTHCGYAALLLDKLAFQPNSKWADMLANFKNALTGACRSDYI